MSDFVTEPHEYREPRDVFVSPPVFRSSDSGGLLGPPFQKEIFGRKLDCMVYDERSLCFRNPFDKSLSLIAAYSRFIVDRVFWCEIQGLDGNITSRCSMFTFFSIAPGQEYGYSFYSSANEFLPWVDGVKIRSNFFTNKQQFYTIPYVNVEFRGDVVCFCLKKDGSSFPNLLPRHKAHPVAVGDAVMVAGFPQKISDEKIVSGYKKTNQTCGTERDSLEKSDFVEVYQRIFGNHDALVVSNGFVRQDTSHAFLNTNNGMIGGPLMIFDGEDIKFIGIFIGFDREAKLQKFHIFNDDNAPYNT